MLRALYTAATGMTAQQLNLDTIANNLANSSTNGFQQRRIGFSDIVRIVEATCEAALAEGIAPTPTDVAEALAVDHVARERAAALLH